MSKVLPSTLSDEKLLELLNKDSKELTHDVIQVFSYEGDIVPFLANYNISPGDSPVSKKLLYRLYKCYSKEPLDHYNFNIQLGVYLKPTRNHFLINLDQFAISNHIYHEEKTRDKTKSLTYQKHFNWFIQESKIKQGTIWIEGFILFYFYKDFCKSRRINPKLGYNNFHKFLKLYYPYKRLKENRSLWFKINQETANFYTEEEKNVIRQARISKEKRGSKEGKEGESEKN